MHNIIFDFSLDHYLLLCFIGGLKTYLILHSPTFARDLRNLTMSVGQVAPKSIWQKAKPNYGQNPYTNWHQLI